MLATIVVLAAVFVAVQGLRSVPSAVFRPAVATSVRLPGTSPSLPWPSAGSAALSMDGIGLLGQAGSTQPVPVASITKVMTAYVVLTDHPLGVGEQGPAIAVTPAVVAAYETGLATGQSVVSVSAGESLTELQALEGLLIASGNDLATLLADWDAPSSAAFVAKMNSAAHDLGLGSTHFVDVSGLDPGSVSTPDDLIRLGQAAMAIPAFSSVVNMAQADLPVAGVVHNFDYDLGHDGMVGIKTGSDSAAGGCFLFEARQSVGATTMTLVGAVLGQQTASPLSAALDEAEALTKAAFSALTTVHVVAPGDLAGRIVSVWGSSVAVRAPAPPVIVSWPGLSVPVRLRVGALPSVVAAGSRLGVLQLDLDGRDLDVALRASSPLAGPSLLWRLTRF